MLEPTNRRKKNQIVFLFAMVYVVSYLTRLNFGAIVSEMVDALQVSKSTLSMSLTGCFIFYGIGQIVSGICGDIMSPKKLVAFGLGISSLLNIGIPFCSSPYQMLFIWSANGFSQAFIWPPLVKLMSSCFNDEEYTSATTKVAWGGSFGTIIIYLLSPVIISVAGWKAVFYASAVCGLLMVFIWNILAFDVKESEIKKKPAEKENAQKHVLFNPLMLWIMVAIILQGMLRDGLATWIPSFIAETFHLSNEISIFTSVILPIFSIISVQIASLLYKKKFTNPITCAGVFFLVGTISAVILLGVNGVSAGLSVTFSALLNACMNGANLTLISFVPLYFKKYGCISTASGVLNFCTYIGSALSTYGIALIAENCGWSTTILVWALVAASGALICAFCKKPWAQKFQFGNSK